MTFGGDDRRKNSDIAVKAVRHLNLLYGRRIPLKVIGFYSVAYSIRALTAAGGAENAGFLEFYPETLDEKVFYADSPDRWVRPSIPDRNLSRCMQALSPPLPPPISKASRYRLSKLLFVAVRS